MFELLKFLIEDTKLRVEEKKKYQEEDEKLFEEHNQRVNDAIAKEKEKILQDEEKSKNSIIGKIVSSNELTQKAKDKKNVTRIDRVVKKLNSRYESERALLEKQRKEQRAIRDKKRQRALTIYGTALAVLLLVIATTVGIMTEKNTADVTNNQIKTSQTVSKNIEDSTEKEVSDDEKKSKDTEKIDYVTGDRGVVDDSRGADDVSTIVKEEQENDTEPAETVGGTQENDTETVGTVGETQENNQTYQSQSTGENKVIVPEQSQQTQEGVWIPQNGGTKYHSRSSCSGMKDPIQVSLETAIANNFSPCKKCY